MQTEMAERAILGAVLEDSDAIYQCGDLKPDDFEHPHHRVIFATMTSLAMQGHRPDLVTIVAELGRRKQLRSAGDVGFISDLVNGLVAPNVGEYVRLVVDSAKRRKLLALSGSIKAMCEDQSESTADCMSVSVDRLLELAGSSENSSLRLAEYSGAVFESINKLANTPKSDLPVGLPTGIPKVDDITTGIREGELWIIASFTGEGKTVLATQIIVENASRGIPVLWFTHEMSRKQVLLRMIPNLTNGVVKGRHLRDPRHMTPGQLMEFMRTQQVIDTWPLWVNDCASMEITALFAQAMAQVKRNGIRLIVVDYIQLVKGRGESRYERVTDVSNQLRELAKMSSVPVLAVSQMSKPENREKRTPRIFDLKESGSIEQDAHVIVMPYRPQEKDGHYTGEDLIIIGKQREGPTGSVKVRFDSLTLTFQPKEGDSGYDDSMF